MIGLAVTIVMVLAIVFAGMWIFESEDEEDRNNLWRRK